MASTVCYCTAKTCDTLLVAQPAHSEALASCGFYFLFFFGPVFILGDKPTARTNLYLRANTIYELWLTYEVPQSYDSRKDHNEREGGVKLENGHH